MSEKQDRQGVRTATDLERKYQFDKRFAEIMGVALDSQKSVTEIGSTVSDKILDMHTSIMRDAESITMEALKSYVETSDYEEFQRTVSSLFELTASDLTIAFTQAIANATGYLESQLNTITKYFTFDINGMTIGQVDNPNKVVIDNDEIVIMVNDKAVQHFKADGSALIPILNVTETVNLLGLVLTEDSTTIDLDYGG